MTGRKGGWVAACRPLSSMKHNQCFMSANSNGALASLISNIKNAQKQRLSHTRKGPECLFDVLLPLNQKLAQQRQGTVSDHARLIS